jgi:Putative zincin peptidase
MNCWKTINLSKDVGHYRILFISMLTMLFIFILTYLPINLLLPNIHLKDDHFFIFILLLFSMFPIHKLLHVVPLLISGSRVSMKIKFFYLLPVIQVKASESIKKRNMLLSLMSPFLIVTIALLLGSLFFSDYLHYFCIAMALHIGICVPDFMISKHLLLAPKMCFIEEFDDGYEVLVQR